MGDVKHTKGPWEWKDDDREKFGHYRLHPGILATDLSDGTPWGDEIDRANARLIAAAPDLLEALKAAKEVVDVAEGMTACRSDDDFIWSAQKLINAALAKATSPSTPDMEEVSHG